MSKVTVTVNPICGFDFTGEGREVFLRVEELSEFPLEVKSSNCLSVEMGSREEAVRFAGWLDTALELSDTYDSYEDRIEGLAPGYLIRAEGPNFLVVHPEAD